MEEWRPIPGFPGYSVSNLGNVRNDELGHDMGIMTNQFGLTHVGLTRNLVQHRRAVGLLVAKAFLPPPPNASFDTPIHLNGDRSDSRVENLLWRPRWFAVKYNKQFLEEPKGFRRPVVEKRTGEVFPTSWDAAIKYGLIDHEIMVATMNNTFVWPTYQTFRTVE